MVETKKFFVDMDVPGPCSIFQDLKKEFKEEKERILREFKKIVAEGCAVGIYILCESIDYVKKLKIK